MRGRAWALGFLAASGAYLAAALSFPFGSMVKPGPGFYPIGVGVFLCAAAAAVALGAAGRARPRVAAAAFAPGGAARVATTMAGLVGFCLLLPWLGYPACAFLFVAVLLRRLGPGGWTGAVVIALAAAAASYYAFAVLLGVPLPRGVLFE